MTTNQVLVKMILDRWNASVKNFDQFINTLSDEQLEKEIAPGKNRGIYLLGHLIAVHDDMLPLLNLGDKKYPNLKDIFLDAPDKTLTKMPSTQELRLIWAEQNQELKQKFENFTADNWFEKHTAVTDQDFANELHRNKLNIILTRTTHLAYHTGQLMLTIKKIKDFTLTLSSNKTPQEVFEAVNDVRGWWTGYYDEEIIGETEKLNDEFSFRAGGDVHCTSHKLVEVIPNQKVVWLTTQSDLSFIEKRDEWTGTKVIFEISEKNDETQLTFTHEGLTPEVECYEDCVPAWTAYLQNKLLPMITNG